jgi:dCMP deaminase
METAGLWSEHSTCSRLPVGAVISRDGRSFSTGYNGAPAGLPHCDHSLCICGDEPTGYTVDHCPRHGACRTAVHAELNALMFAARYGLMTEGAEIHTTHQPCLNCAMAIINAGIIRVVYLHPYRDNGGLDLLIAAGVTAQKGV